MRELSSMDGESLFPVVKCIHLLMIAQLVFLEVNNDVFKDIKVNLNFFLNNFTFKSVKLIKLKFSNWWSLRTIYLYQQLIEERSATLSKMATSILKDCTLKKIKLFKKT